MVVVDTQARTSVGVDENSAKDIGQLIGNLDAVRTACPDTAVLVIHHTPRGSTNPRGSTSIEGAADTILLAVKDESLVTVKATKQKDSDGGPEILLRLVPKGNGSAVLTNGMGGDVATLNLTAKLIYDQMLELGGIWTMPRLTEQGITRSTAQRYLKDLEYRGMVTVDRTTSVWKYTAQRPAPGGPAVPQGPRPAGPQPVDNPVDNPSADNTLVTDFPADSADVTESEVGTPVGTSGHPGGENPSNVGLTSGFTPSGGAHYPVGTPAHSAQGVPTGAHEVPNTKAQVSGGVPTGAQGCPEPGPGGPRGGGSLEAPPAPGLSLNNEHSGGKTDSAPPPPQPSAPDSDPVKARAKASKQARADMKAAERQAKISEAAGPDVIYPVVVTRRPKSLDNPDGLPLVTEISLADAETLLALQEVTVDVETSGYPLGHELFELRLAQLGCADYGVVLDPADDTQAELITRTLEQATTLHAHNATADITPLAHTGLADFDAMWLKMDDTVIPAKLADPSSTGSDPGLKRISDHLLGDQSATTPADVSRKALFTAMGCLLEPKVTDPPAKNGWYSVNRHSTTFARYAGSDVLDCALVAQKLPQIPDWLAHRERTVAHMVSRVALQGVPIDAGKVEQLHTEHTEGRRAATDKIQAAYGIDNPGSAKQVAERLAAAGVELPRTKPSKTHPDGQLSVAAGVLEALKGQYDGTADELISDVLAYRHHNTALGLFVEPYSVMVKHGDGRARTTIYTLGADTGRMSSTRFNFQQLPKKGGVRSMLVTDPGMLQIGADFSSVEIRVAAEVSGDQNLLRMLEEGLDPHAFAAELVFGSGWTKEQRYKVKAGVFGRIYGGGLTTLASQMGVPHWVAQKLIDAIDTLWPTLAEWSRSITRAVESGLMTTWTSYSGRVIHLPRDKAYAAPNYIIQGTARELLMDALLRWRETRWGSAVMWPVHDEIDAHVPEAEAAEATLELVRCMETTMPSGVRIIAEPSEPSTFWRDAA
jgi:DNA polymerase I-like protein with 3'-5' exonuclease and polymerase domains